MGEDRNLRQQADLDARRRAYARDVLDIAKIENPRLEAALASVPRESFLGDGPWRIGRFPDGSVVTPDRDPIHVYEDAVIALVEDKGLNNGQPSFVAMLIDACAARPGDHIVHIGTGTGYYTALLARMAGPGGKVLGIEIEPALARQAAESLRDTPNAQIIEGDGWTRPIPPADAILVNAGTPGFAEGWLDALKPGGRLVCPLCVRDSPSDHMLTQGVVFAIQRDAHGFAARSITGTAIYACVGAGNPDLETRLTKALKGGRAGQVRRLRRHEGVAEKRCWLKADSWALTYD